MQYQGPSERKFSRFLSYSATFRAPTEPRPNCECVNDLRQLSSPRERVLGTCVRPGVAEPDCEPVEG